MVPAPVTKPGAPSLGGTSPADANAALWGAFLPLRRQTKHEDLRMFPENLQIVVPFRDKRTRTDRLERDARPELRADPLLRDRLEALLRTRAARTRVVRGPVARLPKRH